MIGGVLRSLRRRLRSAAEIYEGIFAAPYRAELRREQRRLDDAFLLMAVPELLGVPNPTIFYTLELYPWMIADFHEWHRRMGMERPPEGGWRCC